MTIQQQGAENRIGLRFLGYNPEEADMIGRAVITTVWNDSEANLVRLLLESYGISASVSSDVPHSVYPLTVNGLGEIRISVAEGDREEAARILEAHKAEGNFVEE